MPTLHAFPHRLARPLHDVRIAPGERRALVTHGLAMLLLATASQPAAGASGSDLRGLRPPGLVDFASFDAFRAGVPEWHGGYEPGLASSPRSSALYGLGTHAPYRMAREAQPARFSYSYSDAITGVVESGPLSGDPYVPGYAVSSQLVRTFGSGLGIGLGLRQKQFGSNVFALAVEQEWGAFRGGYTLYSGRTDQVSATAAHRFQLKFAYSDRSSIGLSYTSGRELNAGFAPLAGGESRDWALSGHHWLAPQWALTYDLVNSEQAAYRRQGLRFGIRHTF